MNAVETISSNRAKKLARIIIPSIILIESTNFIGLLQSVLLSASILVFFGLHDYLFNYAAKKK